MTNRELASTVYVNLVDLSARELLTPVLVAGVFAFRPREASRHAAAVLAAPVIAILSESVMRRPPYQIEQAAYFLLAAAMLGGALGALIAWLRP